ncbi:hypothetical protein M0805_008718 [Coniferiporia weirii]|nr:hypothetical protein M0805_008718 [Coniferiporia weirii]
MDAQLVYALTRESFLYISPIFAALSVSYVSVKWLKAFLSNGKTPIPVFSAGSSVDSAEQQNVMEAVKALDGLTITLFRFLRLLIVFALLSLEVYKLDVGQRSGAKFYHLLFYLYVSVLAISSIVASPRWRDVTSRQLAFLLFAEFAVYFILDGWPYATLTPSPFDPASDPVTWTRLVLLALSGVVVPLIMPRPFRALTPGAQPSLEDTASLISRYTYSFLDGVVFHTFRNPDITIADMPHMPERVKINELSKKAFAALDPAVVGKRHVIWGVFRVWGKDYVLLCVWMSLFYVTEFSGAYGLKNLLEYLETGNSPYKLQPWVWIVVLAIGPVISAFFYTQFIYISSRVNIKTTSIFTYLVFHHALRIRLKSDTLSSEKSKVKKAEDKKPSNVDTQASTTPAANETGTRASSSGKPASSSGNAGAATAGTAGKSAEQATKGGHAKEKTGHVIGKINNLITSDIAATVNFVYVIALPTALLQVTICIVFLYNLLGWRKVVNHSPIGFVLLLIFSPVPAYIVKTIAKVHRGRMAVTDKRVQAVTESLGILRMIKLFAWEPYILNQLARSRDEELSGIKSTRLLESGMDIVNTALPLLARLIVLSIYTLVMKGDLTASRIFTALMVFSMLDEQIFRIMHTIPEFLKAKISFDRFTEFLNTTELLSEDTDPSSAEEADQSVMIEHPSKDIIGFNACSFSWDSFNNEDSYQSRGHDARKQFELRFDDEVVFKRGHINLIVGPTASGKTSVLMALLGEMYCKLHGVNSWYNLPRDAGIAYAPQESWVLNETIRKNILFGGPYDEERYKKVLHQCALEQDLSLWKAGDLTEARVTLARALYSQASILLLDDVLAALDVHTAKWIVDKAFKGDLIQGRTILLVTHNIALTAPIASHVIDLGGDGSVSAQGSVSEVLKKDSQLRAQIEKEREEISKVVEDKLENEKVEGKAGADVANAKKDAGKLVIKEEKAMGRVETAAIMLYVRGVGGPLAWALVLGTRLLALLAIIFQTWFMGYWSSQYEKHPSSEIPVLRYLGIYVLISMSGLIADFASQALWAYKSMRASRIIYFRLLESIFASSFRWLDITPVGRIITRCTQDIGTIDDQLARQLSPFIRITINLICLFSSAVLMVGWYAFVPGLIMVVLGGLLSRVYLKCQISIRREVSNAKAPVMSQVGAALAGLQSIRAYGAQNLFYSVLQERIDVHQRASLTFADINRWIAIRLDSLGAVFAGVVSTYLVYGGKVEAGTAGFTLSMVLLFTRLILYWVRLYNMLEIYANSLERMLEFTRIEHEPVPEESGNPPAYWPSSGELRVENLSARYSDDSPEVLRDISFEVRSGERVGVVGRTGAGKSTIALALLRAIKTTGKVYYDGLVTDEINLDALRSNITLIPQQPELIHGTLRENLDPFKQYDDALLNDALRAAGFFNSKLSDPDSHGDKGVQESVTNAPSAAGEIMTDAHTSTYTKIGLDTMVESAGTNFSLGQRQIIALARAIIRRSKLLILDEATAAIDYSTDLTIQKTLRTEFSRDTTLITIAHRLQTIMDYDKIMVLDAGQVIEFDSPKTLLKKEKGLLRALVDESDDRENLFKLAGVQ